MAKGTGLGSALYVAGRDIAGEAQVFNISGSKGMQNMTTLRQLAYDRAGLIPNCALSHETLLDPTAGHAHAYLSTLPTTDDLVTVCIPEALGGVAISMMSKQINYDPARPQEGSLTFKTEAQSSGGTFWDHGVLLTPGMRTDTGATNGASVNFLAPKAFGLQAYLHVFAFTGTTCTIAIQSSSDNGAGDAFSTFTGSSFAAVTAGPQTQRISTARNGAVEQYLRVATSGTFTSITFAVAVVVNDVTVVI